MDSSQIQPAIECINKSVCNCSRVLALFIYFLIKCTCTEIISLMFWKTQSKGNAPNV